MYTVKKTKQFNKWLEALDSPQRKSMQKLIIKLEIFGYMLTADDSKKVTGSKYKLKELRCTKFGNRVYYFFFGDKIDNSALRQPLFEFLQPISHNGFGHYD